MNIYNTLTRRLEQFTPLENGHVRMYTCGPTVYDHAHIGNFRAYVFEDILRRHLEYLGYRVTQVMNLTDVDDKTIRRSTETGVALNEYTAGYKKAFFDDIKALGIEPAEHYPAATEHVPEMIALIRSILNNGYAYRSDDGSVYFSVSKFKDYGKLAHLDTSELRPGARVAQDEYEKENAADFVLWKAWSEADGDVAWDSPWGKGRPGWHIECSAMSMKYLGQSFDLHTGGADNIFPHHENEIAQSEAATGRTFVKYWMHCGYLVVDGVKMSKSLGNFHTLRQLLDKGYTGREVRYVLLSAHYRQPLNFTLATLDAARTALSRLNEFTERLREKKSNDIELDGPAPAWAEDARARFKSAMDDDLNTPQALAALFDMIHEGNRTIDCNKPDAREIAGAMDVLRDLDRVLGILQKTDDRPDREIADLVEQREEARKLKQWKEADEIRKKLANLGWEVRDTSAGPKIIKKK